MFQRLLMRLLNIYKTFCQIPYWFLVKTTYSGSIFHISIYVFTSPRRQTAKSIVHIGLDKKSVENIYTWKITWKWIRKWRFIHHIYLHFGESLVGLFSWNFNIILLSFLSLLFSIVIEPLRIVIWILKSSCH